MTTFRDHLFLFIMFDQDSSGYLPFTFWFSLFSPKLEFDSSVKNE